MRRFGYGFGYPATRANKLYANFTTIGKNKFNKTNYVNNFELLTNGASSPNTGSSHTNFIPITDGAKIVSLSGFTAYTGSLSYICFYDANQTYISRITKATSYTEGIHRIPNAAKFMRVGIITRPTAGTVDYNTIQIEWWQKTAYAAYTVTTESLEVDSNGNKVYNLMAGKNKFNKNAYLIGYRYDEGDAPYATANLTETYDVRHAVTDFLPIPSDASFIYLSGFSTYTGSDRRVYFLDANKAYISFVYFPKEETYRAFYIPSNAAFAVVSLYEFKTSGTVDTSTVQIEFYGETAYEAYSETLVKTSNYPLADTKGWGKKVLLFGDSIMETNYNWEVAPPAYEGTEGGRTNWNTMTRGFQKFARTTRNYAGSGARYRNIGGLTNKQKIDFQITTAIANNASCDIIIICCGTNDGAPNGTDLGSFATAMSKGSLAALDKTKYYEAIRWAFWSLQIAYPTAKVFVGNVLPRADLANSVYDNNNLAIQQMAAQYGFIYVNQRDDSGVNRANETWEANGVDLSDGLHPNHNGWLKIGQYWNGILNANL